MEDIFFDIEYPKEVEYEEEDEEMFYYNHLMEKEDEMRNYEYEPTWPYKELYE